MNQRNRLLCLSNECAGLLAKTQSGLTFSSSKAEYVATSKMVKEIKFMYYLLKEIGIEVNLPIMDNVGAMFMAHNALSGVRRVISINVIITSEKI
jgi:hypothetical protein